MPPQGVVIVGRAREQQVRREKLAEAVVGNGSVLLLSGEEGIGKTALAGWLTQEAAAKRRWGASVFPTTSQQSLAVRWLGRRFRNPQLGWSYVNRRRVG